MVDEWAADVAQLTGTFWPQMGAWKSGTYQDGVPGWLLMCHRLDCANAVRAWHDYSQHQPERMLPMQRRRVPRR